MGRLLYLAAGAAGGVALSENKELVGASLISFLKMAKSVAATALEVEVQGSKLSEVPVLGQALTYVCDMEINEELLRQGVNTASAMSKEAVRTVAVKDGTSGGASASSSSSFPSGGSIIASGFFLALGSGTAYCLYDAKARQAVLAYTRTMEAHVARSFNEFQRMAPIYSQQAQREIIAAYSWAQVNVPRIADAAVVEARRQVDKVEQSVRRNGPRLYHRARTQCDLYYIQAIAAFEKLASKANKAFPRDSGNKIAPGGI